MRAQGVGLAVVAAFLLGAGLWVSVRAGEGEAVPVAARPTGPGPASPAAAPTGVEPVAVEAAPPERAASPAAPPKETPAMGESESEGSFTLEGRVVGPTGAGVPDQVVVLRREGRPRLDVPAEADGSFRIEGLAAGTARLGLDPRQVPEAWLSPFEPPGPDGIEVVIPAEGPVVLELVLAGVVSGVVRYADGSSAADLAVRLVSTDAPLAPDVVARTDARGRYELRGAHAVRYELLVDHRLDYTGALALPPPVAIHPDEGGMLLLDPIVIGGGQGAVTGLVLDGAGAPRPGLTVLCYRPGADGAPARIDPIASAVTDAQGRYRFEGIHGGRVFVHAAPAVRSLPSAPVPVELPAGGGTTELPPLRLGD